MKLDVETLLPNLRRMARGLRHHDCKTLDRADLVQSAALSLLTTVRGRYNPRLASWKTYALQRSRDLMLDEMRRVLRTRSKKQQEELPKFLQSAKVEIERDLWDAVQRIVGPGDAGILKAHYRDGMTRREIAATLRYHPSRITQRMKAALARLREDLKVA